MGGLNGARCIHIALAVGLSFLAGCSKVHIVVTGTTYPILSITQGHELNFKGQSPFQVGLIGPNPCQPPNLVSAVNSVTCHKPLLGTYAFQLTSNASSAVGGMANGQPFVSPIIMVKINPCKGCPSITKKRKRKKKIYSSLTTVRDTQPTDSPRIYLYPKEVDSSDAVADPNTDKPVAGASIEWLVLGEESKWTVTIDSTACSNGVTFSSSGNNVCKTSAAGSHTYTICIGEDAPNSCSGGAQGTGTLYIQQPRPSSR